MEGTLVHELAHAEVWLNHGDAKAARGLGFDWMQLMMRIGQCVEGERNSQADAFGRDGFRRALALQGSSSRTGALMGSCTAAPRSAPGQRGIRRRGDRAACAAAAVQGSAACAGHRRAVRVRLAHHWQRARRAAPAEGRSASGAGGVDGPLGTAPAGRAQPRWNRLAGVPPLTNSGRTLCVPRPGRPSSSRHVE